MSILLKALHEIEGTGMSGIGYPSFAFVAILAEFLFFTTWQHFLVLSRSLVSPVADRQVD